ncbi:MAG: sporulation protein YabP [Bacilli bacterium]|nr:sporulation protein YabP [Bacilli bacterium]
MDKLKEINTNLSHSFSVSERKNIIITGVVKIESFDKEEFLLETVQGMMNIKGENLEVIKLDTYQGNVTIKGKIDGINYIEEVKNKESGLFNRLFK